MAVAALFALGSAARDASAEGSILRADLVEAKDIKLDGIPKEWPSGLLPLTSAVKGRRGRPDLEAKGAVAYDADRVFVGVDVTDDVFRPGDAVELVLGFPGGAVHAVTLVPGEPGKSAGVARAGGSSVAGAKVVEAPTKNGWSLEASIPWSAFPPAKTVRVALRGALFVHDADDSSAVEAVVGSANGTSYAALPSMQMEAEQALTDGLLKQKSLHGAPRYNLLADVAGDPMKERVLVYDRFLVVLGPTFRKGKEYFWSDLGVDVAGGMLPALEARDVTGDGQAELVLRKRFGSGGKWREMMQILKFGADDVPSPIFQHEVGIQTDKGSIANVVRFVPDGAKVAIVVEPGIAKDLDASTYTEKTETAFDPLLLPWGTIKSRTYKLTGSTFTKVSEEKQAAAPPPPPSAAAVAPKAPPPPSAAELLEQVYALYKKDRGVTGKPRYDFAVDVAGDRTVERVLLHDRDLVVFGKGFKSGTGYAFLTLAQFASGSDITEITTRDLTGDNKSEIVVKGILHATAPKEVGGGPVDREVVLVFQVASDTIRRVFAAEIGRSMGRKKVAATLAFFQAGKSVDIELSPGKATEWTEKTYPFNADTAPVGGFEPLILPWDERRSVRYRWTGSVFAR